MEANDRHWELAAAAIARDGDGQRALLAGDAPAARAGFATAADLYRQSWAAAPPASYGRLVGMLKSAVLAGGGGPEAAFALAALAEQPSDSPTAAYARAIACLIIGDDAGARAAAGPMHAGSEAFGRAATAIEAIAAGDAEAYRMSVAAIVGDFTSRGVHLTGVPIADTALMLEHLAASRGFSAGVESPLLPRLRT